MRSVSYELKGIPVTETSSIRQTGFDWKAVGDATFLVCIGSPVEEDATTCYTVIGPKVLGAFVICIRALDIFTMSIVVESLTGYVCELGSVSS